MKRTTLRKLSLRSIGIIGSAVFATFFAFTYSVPGWVEDFAADYIERQVEKRIDETIGGIQLPDSDNALTRFAQSVLDKNEVQIEQLKSSLRDKVHEQWAASLAAIRNLDCECRQEYAEWFEAGFESGISLLQAANDRITDFIQSAYMDIATELKNDIRIFTGSNAVAFLLLLLVSFLKPEAVTHLHLPGILLATSTLICSYFYIFETNWLLTIIYSDYLGFVYLGWLSVVFLLLCDVVFNRGRVITEIFNAILNAIGSAASIGPC